MKTEQEFENEIAAALGPRYVWALHTEPVRIVMEMLRKTRQELTVISKEESKNG